MAPLPEDSSVLKTTSKKNIESGSKALLLIKQLTHGLSLDGRQLRPAIINLIGDDLLMFVLQEGRKRQIRRMCELVDLEVRTLTRVRIGRVKLGQLPRGKWRHLSQQEQF